jgi:phage tail-like protein
VNTLTGDALPSREFGTSPRFAVEVDGTIVASFSECSGLSATVRADKWEEGGVNYTTYKFPGRTEFDNLTLKHGVTDSLDLYTWFLQTVQGLRCRKTITIKLVPQDLEGEIRSWHLANAFPTKWTGPSLQVGSNAVAIESLEFAHDGLIFT